MTTPTTQVDGEMNNPDAGDVRGEREPFNPGEPFDAVTETFRLAVCESVLQAMKTTIYREMKPEDQITAMIAGTLVGLVGATFASMADDKEGRDYIVSYIASCLPMAREYAEAIANDPAVNLADVAATLKGSSQ